MRASCLAVRMSAPRSCRTTLRSLYADLLPKISASGSVPRSCRATCARALSADVLRKTSASRSLHQVPVGPLAPDYLCMRISCARCVCVSSSLCMGISCARCLCLGALVQDRCTRISCPRSLCQDLCAKIL